MEPLFSEIARLPRDPAGALAATRQSLLTRLKDHADHEGWRRFFDTYAGIIQGLARTAGCSAAEADDVLQETMLSVAREMPGFRYDPALGSFKGWLFQITRRRVADHFRRRRPGDARGSDTQIPEQLADSGEEKLNLKWEAEWRIHQLQLACERVKKQVSASQWQMFDLSTLQAWPMDRITGLLGVNRAQVYMSKMRVSRLIKRAVENCAEPAAN